MATVDDFEIFEVCDFPLSMKLYGADKFKTPRTQDERVPILVLPECVSRGVTTFGDKSYLTLTFEDAEPFRNLLIWMTSILETEKSMFQLIRISNDGVSYEMRIRLSDVYSVIDKNGMPAHRLHSLCEGSVLRCAVDIPCLWESATEYGLSAHLVQAKIMKSNSVCQIMPEMDHEVLTPIAETTYRPLEG